MILFYTPWIICEEGGKIMAAHCMARLGEACSHIAPVMFYIEAAVRIRNAKPVTHEKAYWVLPSATDKVEYAPVSKMDFASPSTKKKQLDKNIELLNSSAGSDNAFELKSKKIKRKQIPKPETEIEQFFEKISKNCKPSILSIVPGFSKKVYSIAFNRRVSTSNVRACRP